MQGGLLKLTLETVKVNISAGSAVGLHWHGSLAVAGFGQHLRLLKSPCAARMFHGTVWWFEHSWVLYFFGTGMKIDLFQSCGHCWVFQICWYIECDTLTELSIGFEIAQFEFLHLH